MFSSFSYYSLDPSYAHYTVHASRNGTLLILSRLIPGRVPWRLQSTDAYPKAWIVKIRLRSCDSSPKSAMVGVKNEERSGEKRGREKRQGSRELGLLSVRVIGHQKTAPLIGHYLPFPCIYLSHFYSLLFPRSPWQYLPSRVILVVFMRTCCLFYFTLIVWVRNCSRRLLLLALTFSFCCLIKIYRIGGIRLPLRELFAFW